MMSVPTIASLTAAAEKLVEERDVLQQQIDDINVELQAIDDELTALEEQVEAGDVDCYDLELKRLAEDGYLEMEAGI